MVTFNKPLYTVASVGIQDEQGFVPGVPDAARLVFTISGVAQQALPLTADTDTFTMDTLFVAGGSFTDIHGRAITINARLSFNVDP